MFLFLKCMYLIWVVVFENWGNDIFLVLYLIWNVLGRVGNFSGLMINVMKILENFIIFCSGQEIFINVFEIIINFFLMKLFDEFNLRCLVVEKIIIYFNGIIKIFYYMKKCVVFGG